MICKILENLRIISDMVKDEKCKEANEAIQKEFDNFFKTEAKQLRKKVDEINKSIFMMNMVFKELKSTYDKLKSIEPDCSLDNVERYLEELKKNKVELEVLKRSIVRDKTM